MAYDDATPALADLDALTGAGDPLLAALATLPGSYDGPDGRRSEPYGLRAYGEAAPLATALRAWVDAPTVVRGTQFLFAGGFGAAEVGPAGLAGELAGAEVVAAGDGLPGAGLAVPLGPLSAYTYASYLGRATGHGEAVAAMERALAEVRERCATAVPTEANPAKQLAWALWGRVPLLLASRRHAGLPIWFQHLFARVAKCLAIATGDHALEVVSGAFESRHRLGDDVVALVLGGDDPELRLAREVLESRVAQIESLTLDAPPTDPVAAAVALWYQGAWTAAYLAILEGREPEEAHVYQAVARAADGAV